MKEGDFDLEKLGKAVDSLKNKLAINSADDPEHERHHAIFRIADDENVPVNRIEDLYSALVDVKQGHEPDKEAVKNAFNELFKNQPGVDISNGQYLVKSIFDFVNKQAKQKIEVWAYAAQMKALKEFLEVIMKA